MTNFQIAISRIAGVSLLILASGLIVGMRMNKVTSHARAPIAPEVKYVDASATNIYAVGVVYQKDGSQVLHLGQYQAHSGEEAFGMNVTEFIQGDKSEFRPQFWSYIEIK